MAYQLAKYQAVQCSEGTAQLVRHCQDKDTLSAPTLEQLHRCIAKLNDSSNNLEQCTWDLQKIQDEDERDNTNIEATALLSTIGAASNTCLEIFDAATQQHTEITPAVQQNSTNKPAFFCAVLMIA